VWSDAPNDVYVGGSYEILHYDGNEWTSMRTGYSSVVRALWGFGPGAVFAVGTAGSVLRHTNNP
jgi:hypothetical protein